MLFALLFKVKKYQKPNSIKELRFKYVFHAISELMSVLLLGMSLQNEHKDEVTEERLESEQEQDSLELQLETPDEVEETGLRPLLVNLLSEDFFN